MRHRVRETLTSKTIEIHALGIPDNRDAVLTGVADTDTPTRVPENGAMHDRFIGIVGQDENLLPLRQRHFGPIITVMPFEDS